MFRLRSFFRKDRFEGEMDEELRFHLEQQIEDNIKAGMDPQEARYAALRGFGGVEQIKEECRDTRKVSFVEDFLQDTRYAVRVLLRNRGFTLTALLTLALGIGANTAIFSVVDAVLLRPLHFENADQLMSLFEENIPKGRSRSPASPANFVDWKARSRAFEGIAAIGARPFNLTGTGEPERVLAMLVTADFFPVLRARTFMGRIFLPEEYPSAAAPALGQVVRRGEEQSTGEGAVILSYELWQRRFGGNREVIGGTAEVDGRRVTVVGVMPRDFAFTEIPGWGKADCWIPQAYVENENPRARTLTVIARRETSVPIEKAQAEMDVIARQLAAKRPDANAGWEVRVVPLHETMVGDLRQELLVLWGAVAFVLLIACANTASLLLAQAAARQREIAVRTSLGASWRRLLQQLLTESTLLAVVAGLVGFLLAIWGLQVLVAVAPENLPRREEIAIDVRVLGFTLILSAITGALSGIAPALRFSKTDLNLALKDGGTTSAGIRRRWTGSSLVVAEIALSLVLLVGAGLMLRSFLRLQALNLGFSPKNVLTFGLNLSRSQYHSITGMTHFYLDLIARIEKIPDVRWAGVGAIPLRSGVGHSFHPEGQAEAIPCGLDAPSPNYFHALGIPLLKGRFFTNVDTEGAQPIAILNRAAAERCWPGEDPIGKRITFDDPGRGKWLAVIGVVDNVRTSGLESDPRPDVYLPLAQSRIMIPGNVLVRTEGDPMKILGAVRSAVRSLDKDLPLTRIATMEQRLALASARRRFNLLLIGTFSVLAFVLATVGIYGVMAYSVTRRTHEIGIRMALGAQSQDALRLIIGQGVSLLVIGEVLGLVAALALNRVMTSMLFGIKPTDSITYLSVSLAWAAVALLACYIPARRATKVDPMTALRYE